MMSSPRSETVCKVCYDRISGQHQGPFWANQEARQLLKLQCFSQGEHTNKPKINMIIHNGQVFPPSWLPPPFPVQPNVEHNVQHPGPSPGHFTHNQHYIPSYPVPPYPPMHPMPPPPPWSSPCPPQPSSYGYPPSSFGDFQHTLNPNAQPFMPPSQSHISVISSDPNISSTGRRRVYYGSYEQRKADPPPLSDMDLPLTLESYRNKFTALLHYEEEEHVSLLAKNCNGLYKISAVSDDEAYVWFYDSKFGCFFAIHEISPNQILYASQACDEVYIVCSPTETLKGFVIRNYDHNSDVLYIGMYQEPGQKMRDIILASGSKTFELKFAVKHTYFNGLHKSLNGITKEALKRIIVSHNDFEEGLDPVPPTADLPVDDLDMIQCNALHTMAYSKSTAPVLIPGPFGSGKTRLLAVATKYFITNAEKADKRCRILLCCCQQDSADIFMRDYFLKMQRENKNMEIVRIVSQVHKRGIISEHVVQLDTLKSQVAYYQSRSRLVVLSTFMTALRLTECFQPGYFTHVLIDEGAQAREPECIAPLSMADKKTRIIIAGDSKQVGPKLTVLGKDVNEKGLGKSLMERLYEQYTGIDEAKSYCVTLSNNYRCLPEILQLSSDLFYKSSLVPCAKVPRIKEYALHFRSREAVSVAALADCESIKEADIIVKEVEQLIFDDYIDTTNICIMCSSQRQASLIREQLRLNSIRGVKVLTSYQMQGQEFDVLFLSTVESISSDGKPFDPLKSFCDPSVFNTAMTRARSLIVAVGNPETLITAERAMGSSYECWHKYIQKCRMNHTYRHHKMDTTHSDEIAPIVEKKPLILSDFTVSSKMEQLSKESTSIPNVERHVKAQTSESVLNIEPKTTQEINRSHSSETLPKNSHVKKKQQGDGSPSTVYNEHFPPLESSVNIAQKQKKKSKSQRQPNIEKNEMVFIPKEQQDVTTVDCEDPQTSDLTPENYRDKFHRLLEMEEKEHESILENKCNGVYKFSMCSNREIHPNQRRFSFCGYIYAPQLDADKVSYAKQASEGIILTYSSRQGMRSEKTDCLNIVKTSSEKGNERIYLGLESGDHLLLNSVFKKTRGAGCIDVSANFVLKYSYFKRLHKGLNYLSKSVIKSKLTPCQRTDFLSSRVNRQRINMIPCVQQYVNLDMQNGSRKNSQIKALYKILNANCSKAPVLVIGSFGTGKTRLLARAAYQILQNDRNSKVLICAHHQKSVDKMLENYFGEMIDAGWYFDTHLARLIPENYYPEIKPRFERYYFTLQKLKMHKGSLRLVLTTFSSSFSLYDYLGRRHFTHILLDEGAQSREPESIIPLCLATSETKVVIAGDHKQVGPSLLVLGNEARENGLKKSLLERLYSIYDTPDLLEVSQDHSATLLTNFRCHHALLSLPSYLFYGSALVTVAEATNALHPDALYPIHFVCSDLNEEIVEVSESQNETEVLVVLSELKKYVSDKKWPKEEWGERNLEDICIMAATANQKSLFFEKLRNEYRSINGVEVLTMYEIQGQEFQAVFMSTAEPTDEVGMSKNPTKSPCEQHVFNTAITRAKSLVVCVGNPFLLLKIEQKMKNERNFWRDYMRRCIIAKTFHIHDRSLAGKSITEVYKNLQTEIFTDYRLDYVPDEGAMAVHDPIINRLQEIIRQQPHYKRCKLQIQYQQQSDQIWKIAETTGERKIDLRTDLVFEEKVECELVIKTRRNAHGLPLDTKQKPIVINGLRNRRGAFNGDIVTVGVLGEHAGQRYGKVIYLVEARHSMKYVCTADSQNIINFYPLDKLEPAIVNLPKLSRYILKCEPDSSSTALSDSPSNHYITVFEESSLNVKSSDDVLPVVKELVPLDMAPSLLFVVKVLSWAPQYRKPLGGVISALPRTNSIFIMERLLRVTYNIQQDEYDHEPITGDEVVLANVPSSLHEAVSSTGESALTGCTDATAAATNPLSCFTIDSEDSINLDDALSVTHLSENRWKMSVLITDVTKVVQKDSELDKRAKQRGTSVYGVKCSHMLPLKLTTDKLSLLPDQRRHAIAISAIVRIDDGGMVMVEEDSCEIENIQIMSLIRLTYGEAQKIILKETSNHDALQEKQDKFNRYTTTNMMLDESLAILYKAAMMLCDKRIGDAAYFSDPGEEGNWHSSILVSELMIWANNEVAKFVYENVPSYAILRRQLPPLSDEVDLLKEVHRHALDYSISLRSICSNDDQRVLPVTQPLLMLSSVWEKLRVDINRPDQQNMEKIRNLLADHNSYPQLAIALIALRSISGKAEYVKSQQAIVQTDDEGNIIECPSPYYHHGLKLNAYTHFTSPIRRYPDIMMQRFVNMILSRSDMSYTELELQNLCTDLNRKLKSASKFEVDAKKIELATKFEDGLDHVEAYLTRSLHKQHKYELYIPSVKYKSIIKVHDTQFDQSKLNCLKRNESCITWRVILVPFKTPQNLFDASKFSQFKKVDKKTVFDLQATGIVQANVFSYENTTTDKDDSDTQRKRCLYASKLADNTVKVNKDTFDQCNALVKKYSLMEHSNQPLSINLVENSDSTHGDVTAVPDMVNSPVICLDISRNFDIGEALKVWIGRNIAKPIPSPGVHLIEVAPSAKVCLQHNKSPAMCFSDTKLQLTSRRSYRSIEEYIALWCKALLAEASYDAVNTDDLVVLTDVPLVWPALERPDNCLDNVYFKPKEDLVFEIGEEQLNLLDFVFKVKILAGDLVCVRYSHAQDKSTHTVDDPDTQSPSSAVYHFVIHKVENLNGKKDKQTEEGSKTISMRPVGDYGCRVSVKWKNIIAQSPNHVPPNCEIQIIKMPVSFNRLFYRLQKMDIDGEWSKLAINVALGRKYTHQIHNAKYLKILKTNPNCLTLWNGDNKKLNEKQEEAIEAALQNRFSLIQGPPGTGKSIVGAHLAYTFAMCNRMSTRNGCVIYCGPSNKAVDVVHDYFLKLNENSTGDHFRILRLYGRTHEKLALKDVVIELKIDYEGSESKCKERFKKDALHWKIRQLSQEIDEIECHMKSLLSENTLPSLTERLSLRKSINSLEEEVLRESYDVILCTCNETCSYRLSVHLNGRIAQCIVDECGMANEPETLTAMSLAEHVVLIGDHKQLQPVVKHDAARQCGLVKSLFERYSEMKEKAKFTFLNIQYRMHSKICEVPSHLYYDDLLTTDNSIKWRPPVGHRLDLFWPQRNQQYPIMFCDVIGEENDLRTGAASEGKTDLHSKYNEKEVQKTMEIIKRLIETHRLNSNGSKDIAVLTPYTAQKKMLMKELEKSKDVRVRNVAVSSIIESQGDEYNIVIVNTVRSLPLEDISDRKFVQPDSRWLIENLGFVIDPHQINVGITRAKHGLIIIGNSVLLSYNDDWKYLISKYKEHGCIVEQ